MRNVSLGNLADLDGVGAFRRFADFELNLVSLAKRVECYSDELVGVEKEIFFAAFNLDEPESLIGEAGDCSSLHSVYVSGF